MKDAPVSARVEYGVKTEAEDILHEAFLRLWQKVETLRDLPEKRCFNYVYTTVRNTALSHLRRSSRRLTQPLDENLPAPTGKGPEEYYLSLDLACFMEQTCPNSPNGAWKS